jgi:hypothetical protein
MIVNVKDDSGREMLAIGCPIIYEMATVKDLRNAIAAAIEICISYKEPKDVSDPYHLYLLSKLNQVLTEDIEKGGEV